MKHIDGVIFDLDGTLVSCELCFKTMRQEIGCPLDEDILAFVDNLDDDAKQIANDTIKRLELNDAYAATWITGAQEFIEHLNHLAIPTAIITRNSREASGIKITNNRIPIKTVITREDAPAKPDPTALINLSNQWQIPPEKLLYVGDYLHDINIAKNAGVNSALFCEQMIPNYAHLADHVFENYQSLKALF